MKNTAFCSKPYVLGGKNEPDNAPHIPAEETLAKVLSNVCVNAEYKHLVVKASPKALAAKPGQFFNILCPSPDDGDLWLRRPQSVYRIDRGNGNIEFLYKCAGRGTKGMATFAAGGDCNMVGPLGVGFSLKPGWKNIVVLGRGVGLATMGPISQLAAQRSRRRLVCRAAEQRDLPPRGAQMPNDRGEARRRPVLALGSAARMHERAEEGGHGESSPAEGADVND